MKNEMSAAVFKRGVLTAACAYARTFSCPPSPYLSEALKRVEVEARCW